MKQSIKEALGTEYKMFYSPAVPCTALTPVLTLGSCIDNVNAALQQHGNTLKQWETYQLNDLAKLVRANWIYQRLDTEPIRKPILVHPENGKLIVDTGDTRLMAVTAKDPSYTLSVLATCRSDVEHHFNGWTVVDSSQRLLEITDFDPESSHLLMQKSSSDFSAIDWIEIGDSSTGHHLHDQDQRIQMMKQFLEMQEENYLFDYNWITEYVDWNLLL